MAMNRPTLTPAEVADALQLSRPALYRQRRALEAAGFPAPLPGFGRRLRWSRAAVEAWLAGAAPGGQVIDIRRELIDRRGIAAAARLLRRTSDENPLSR